MNLWSGAVGGSEEERMGRKSAEDQLGDSDHDDFSGVLRGYFAGLK